MQYLKAILFSFYKQSWFRQMAQPKTKYVVRYLLVLSAVLAVFISIRFAINFSISSGVVVQQVVAQIPPMGINKGKLSTAKPGSYVIRMPMQKTVLAVINTNSQFKGFVNKEAAVWVGPDALHYRFSSTPGAIRYHPVTMTLDHKAVTKIIKEYVDVFIVVGIILCLLVSFVLSYAVLMLLAWAMTPLMRNLAKSLSYTLEYRAARNLSIASITPFFILLTVFYMFALFNTFTAVLLIISLCVYPAIAVQAGKYKRK